MKQHSKGFLALVTEAKGQIREISPQGLKEKIDHKEPLVIIDVREDNEWVNSGPIADAIHLGKGIIERDIEKQIPDLEKEIVVYCSGGFRCALVAQSWIVVCKAG